MNRSKSDPSRSLRGRRMARSDERGATLLLALIFITVVSIVVAAILALVDTSLRTTVAVRARAAQAATADGAAQAAVNALRTSTYQLNSGTPCFGASANMPLANFYQPVNGSAYSATVACSLDTTDSAADGGVAINSGNKPGNAILTLGRSPDEVGLSLHANGKGSIQVQGTVFSNSTIAVDQLTTNTTVTARTGCTGTINGTATPPNPAWCVDAANAGGADPAYPVPNADKTPRAVPACRKTAKGQQGPLVVDLQPGLYTDLNGLNDLTGCGNVLHFLPGTFYFNLGGVWSIDGGYVVGGTATPGQVVDGKTPDMPGSCETPVPPSPLPPGGWINPGPGAGVQFVFAGSTQLSLGKGHLELCGSYATNKPPIVVFGLETPDGAVPAESGCVTALPAKHVDTCAVITSDNSPNSEMYIQGTTYVPGAAVDIQLNNNTSQVFRYGIIARRLAISATGSASLGSPVVAVPDDAPAGTLRTVVNLSVYVCSGTTACPTTGSPQLVARVGFRDPSGSAVRGAREVTVYDWSSQR